jgi:hypothetical protein
VKHEIAATMARDVWGDEGAKRAALAALDKSKGKKLGEVFEEEPVEQPPPQITPEQIEEWEQRLRDPSVSPEEKEMLQMILDKVRSGELGAIGSWEMDVPAEWAAEGETATPPPQVDAVKASTDELPSFGEVKEPKVRHVGPVPREADRVAEIGKSPELVKAVWEELADGQLADRVFSVKSTTIGPDGREIGGGTAYVVVQLVERATPDPADFDKEADKIVQQLEQARGADIVNDWLTTRCNELVQKKEIRIANDVLVTRDEKGETRQIAYGACSNL